MTDAFVITGTRPPSAGSRPSSRQSPVHKSGYHKVSDNSDVDEMLFKSFNSMGVKDYSGYPAAWSKTPKDKKRGKPLLWAPPVGVHQEHKESSTYSLRKSHDLHDPRYKYRLSKHTPSFCDETLFGPRLEEPSFKAPWEEKKKMTGRPMLWTPMDYSRGNLDNDHVELEPYSVDGRPPSRQGRRPASTKTRPTTVESVTSTKSQVWKP